MKKVIIAFSFCLYGMTILNATPSAAVAVDCDEFAADYVAVLEDHFGCLDSDDYNTAYTEIGDWCRDATN